MNNFVGFRFHPTEEEIITYFLERKMRGLGFPVHAVGDVDICKFEPWDLPQHSPLSGDDQVWYFFNVLVYKYPNSKRIDRTTKNGFWKVTGKERAILDQEDKKEIGFKRNLVFYRGRSPNGIKTNWVMHEYNSHKADSYQKKYVLSRLKRKSSSGSDACNEPSHHLASNSGNQVTDQITSPQISNYLPENLRLLLEDNGGDCNSLSALLSSIQPGQGTSYASGSDHNPMSSFLSMIQPEQGTSYSNGFDTGISNFNREQDDAFVDSLWAYQDEYSGQISVHTRLHHDFNPTKSLRTLYVGDSSDTDTEFHNVQRNLVLQSANLFDENVGSEESLMRTSSSSDGGDNGYLQDVIVASNKDKPRINCLRLVRDEFPTSTSACKAQHRTKYHVIEKECAQMQDKVSPKAVPKVEVKESAKKVVDLPRKGNSVVKFGKDQKTGQATKAKTSSKFRCKEANSDHREGSSIATQTPPVHQNINPPSVYLGNVLVSLLLIIFIIREIVYLH